MRSEAKSGLVVLTDRSIGFFDDNVEFGDGSCFLYGAMSCLLDGIMQAEPDKYTVFGLSTIVWILKQAHKNYMKY